MPDIEDAGDDTAVDADRRELDEHDVATLEEADPAPAQVAYSGSDFDVEGLVRRLERGDIVIPSFGHGDETVETAGFQRSFVWSRPQMDRFIESLLLGYPIPGIFLVQQTDKRYLVLDGQQRLRTLAAFYRGMHDGREFALSNVGEQLKGLTYAALNEEFRRVLDNTFIQATIVRSDGSVNSLDAVYQIFERLNAGGTQLTPHEIRIALYAGPFIEFLTELNREPNWRDLWGPESPRLRDQELVLRIIALYVAPGVYKRPLKKFLNDFVATHRDLEDLPVDVVRDRFAASARLLVAGPGRAALRGGRQINAALSEAVFVGLARRLDAGDEPSPGEVSAAVTAMLENPELAPVVSQATADEESVRTRLAIATQTFAAA